MFSNKIVFILISCFLLIYSIQLIFGENNQNSEFLKNNLKNVHTKLFSIKVKRHVVSELILNLQCIKEVATKTLITEPFQNIRGNGTNIHITNLPECCPGHKPYKFNSSLCVPDCGDKCENGICIAPGNCECFPGYVLNLSKDCVQTCPLGCLNGKCHANGTCICNKGYQLALDHGKYCIPICENGCDFQNCSSPGKCTCFSGYEKGENGDCLPVCENNCLYGLCIVPNTCICYPGYNYKDGICQDNCTQKCANGKCIAPNICKCDFGYQYDPLSTMCIPSCYNCQNGVCVAPDTCRCFKGYEKYKDTCKPICKRNCDKGQCIAPDICDCSGLKGDDYDKCKGVEKKCNVLFYDHCLW